MSAIWGVRASALALVGVLAVHEARYFLVPPDHAHELASVHAYLTWLTPLAGALLFLTIVQLGLWTRRARDSGGASAELPSGRALWLAASASLLVVFAAQETVELTAAHAQLPTQGDVLAQLGWQTPPLVLLVGGVLAFLLKGAAKLVRLLTRRASGRKRRRVAAGRPPVRVFRRRVGVLATNLAGRAPPSLS